MRIMFHVTWTESGIEQSSGLFGFLRSAIRYRRFLLKYRAGRVSSARISLFFI